MKNNNKKVFLAFVVVLASASAAFATPNVDSSLPFFGIVEKLATMIWYTAPGIGLLCFAGGIYQLATHGADGNRLMANLFWGAAGCAVLWGGDNKFLKWWMGNSSSGATINDSVVSQVGMPAINLTLITAIVCVAVLLSANLSDMRKKTLRGNC